jgi:general secretion pathway protein J
VKRGPASKGFTLLELLVAVFISALMLTLGYGALNQAAAHRDRLDTAQQSLTDLQRAVHLLTQDFAQMAPRPVRDELGRSVEPALQLDPRQSIGVSLTRGGQSLTLGSPRSRLIRVRYVLEGDQLLRLSSPILDRTAASPPWRRQVILQGVEALQIRALGHNRTLDQWSDTWPLAAAGNSDAGMSILRERPRAIEFRLRTTRYGEIRRVIEVAG